ncbi:CHAT domain-containing protein [Armatimonas sp.]|uniref:CHAT domain-containing protein n=1 Tax=Armatimonas sp. TaxID=1872638 RepID=UPI00286BF291|nr:CHAT domain-containing protein [Armatimonas sp.]
MATFYGKQCVNRYQALREDAKKIGKRALESFTNSVEKAYRDQADILIEQGRILEGQQVLDLLKQQELFDLLRRDAKEFNTAKLTELNEVEAEADRRIKAQGDRILTLAREEETLLAKPEALRADADKRRLLEVKRLLDEAQAQFQKVLESLVALFEQSAARLAAKPFTPADAEAFTTTLKDLREQSGKKPVAVYTLMGENKLRFIILSDLGNPVAREFPITAAELNKKIAAFRIALQNPSVDPRPLGKQLYDILIKPIEADLSGAQAQTLLWSLDGPLRYIPLAALSPDGVHYLIETERANTIFTPAAMNSGALTRAPKPQWQALALGVTQGFASVENQGTTLGFPALTGVRQEVGTVTGLLTGSTTLLDADFTKERLEATLAEKAGKFSVVHIASHFHFQPTGDETRSFLLTGDGKALTLAQLKSLRSNVFSGVDLLTLSACATGLGTVGASGTGAEVEGFGALAQRKGAGAVLASLWSVSDASTSALMQAFYAIHQKEPGLGKAECLRRAQLGLLTGSLPIEARQLGRGPVAATGNKDTTGLPRFVAPASAPAAHPFYWAPFILIGNTR